MTTVVLELSDEVFSALRLSPQEFAREIRLAAAIHWYQRGVISQGKAAEIAGLPRADFIDELARRKIDTVHVDVAELKREAGRG
jgi:predicted HTH domain antitoxin